MPERPAYLQLPITHMYNKIKKLVRTAFHVVPEVPELTNPLTFSIGYCRTSYSHRSKVKAPPLPHSGIPPSFHRFRFLGVPDFSLNGVPSHARHVGMS